VLPSMTRRLVIALCPTHMTVVESGRGWRQMPGDPATFACGEPAAGEPAWQAPLAALRDWLAQGKHAPAQVEIIVSDSFVRYALIPWSDDVQKPAELATLARIHFETLFGAPAAAWEIKADCSDYGKAGIGCALDQALMTALRELCAAHGLRLTSLQPYFMRVFNRWRRRIGRDALFGVVESGQCVLASLKGGAWHSIRTVRLGNYLGAALPVLIEREILLLGLVERAAVYLHALEEVDKMSLRRDFNLTLLEIPRFGAGQASGRSMAWSGAI